MGAMMSHHGRGRNRRMHDGRLFYHTEFAIDNYFVHFLKGSKFDRESDSLEF